MKRLGYFSGAPRVSTHMSAEASGPRAHVIGVIRAFESLGWDVVPFIVGDRMPRHVSHNGEAALTRYRTVALLADFVRLGLGVWNAHHAWRTLGDNVDWVYERFASFQALGRPFHAHGMPWILETNGIFFDEAHGDRHSSILYRLSKHIELRAYRDCDILVCVSNQLKESVLHFVSLDPEKVLVVPNGVDTDRFNPEYTDPIRLTELFVVGFVGSIIDWQGLDLLLSAVANLRTAGIDVFATIVGDGPAIADLNELAQRLGIADQVAFVGRIPADRIPAYIGGFDIGYSGQVPLTSGVMYHSPLKIYEYMAMGKPVIASAFDDATRLAERSNAVLLFEPGSVEDLTNQLAAAYSYRESLVELGNQARKEILENHTWEARVASLIVDVERKLGASHDRSEL